MLKRNLIWTASVAALLSGVALPALAEPVTIRIVAKDLLNTNPDDVKLMQKYEEALKARGTDLKIEIVNLPASGYADKLGAMLLSGDIPDLIYFQGGDTTMSEQGILEDWNNWLPKTTYLKDALYPHNVARLQNYPYLLYAFPPRVSQPVMRADWLSKTGLPVPQTIEDYTKLFKAIKDGNFGGVGSDHTYGLTVPGSMEEADSIFNQAFGVSASWTKDEAGNWISYVISSQQKVKIAFYASLREQGCWIPNMSRPSGTRRKTNSIRAGLASFSRHRRKMLMCMAARCGRQTRATTPRWCCCPRRKGRLVRASQPSMFPRSLAVLRSPPCPSTRTRWSNFWISSPVPKGRP